MPDIQIPPLAEVVELLPPAVAALVLFIAGASLSRRGKDAWVAVASVLAVAVAFGWTFQRLRGLPPFPPRASSERGFWAVAVAAALGLVATIPQLRTRLRVLIGAAVAVVWVAGGLSSEALSGWRLGVVALGAVAWLHLLIEASRCPGPLFGFVTAIAIGASSQTFLMFHAALLAQLGGALAMAMGLIGLSALVFRRPLPGVMALPLGSAMIVLSLDASLFAYESPPPVALVLLAAAPLAPLVFFWRAAPVRATALRVIGAAVLALALAGLGFYLAARVAPPDFG